jgi:hypothetical protein
MTRTTSDDLDRLYSLLERLGEMPGQGRRLGELPDKIRDSALWNLNYVSEMYDPLFLEKLESFVMHSCSGEPRLTN